MFKAIKFLVISIVLLLSVGAGAQRPALQKLSPLVREACLGVQQTGRFNREGFQSAESVDYGLCQGHGKFRRSPAVMRRKGALSQWKSGHCKHSFRPIGDAFAFSFHPPHRGRTTQPGADGHYRHHRFIR